MDLIAPHDMEVLVQMCRHYEAQFVLTPLPPAEFGEDSLVSWQAELRPSRGPGPAPIARGATPAEAVGRMLRQVL
jgi:hypothetical protein